MTKHSFDPTNGIVFGTSGKPVGRRKQDGYVHIEDGRGYVGSAHRMIWESVNGQIPKGMQINHINGVKWDNKIANLELVTPSQNLAHAYRIGLATAKGLNNGRSIGKRRKHGLEAA